MSGGEKEEMDMDLGDMNEFPPLPTFSMGGQSEKIHPGECIRIPPSHHHNPNRMGWPDNAVGLIHSGNINMNVISPTIHQKSE